MLIILQTVYLMHCFKSEAAAKPQYDNNYVNLSIIVRMGLTLSGRRLTFQWPRGNKITPQADLFTTTAEPLGVKRSALVTFPEYVGATRSHLYRIFNCFR